MNKIYFEKYKLSDFSAYKNRVQNHDLMKYITGKVMTEEQAKNKFESILKINTLHTDLGYFNVYMNNQVIGECKLVYNNNLENSLEIGYLLKKDFWKQGIGTKICEHLIALSKNKFPSYDIIAVINPDNIASRKLLEKFNFVSYWKGIEYDIPTEKLILKT